jgi:phosphate starvation-inducible protein PhoH
MTKRASKRRDTAASLHLTLLDVRPLTESQAHVFESDKNQVLHGCAGTGKTFIASYLAYKALLAKEYGKVIYIRSAVATRNIGFLPGTEAEKVAVYELPYKDIANELFDRGGTYDDLKKKGVVEFMTTSHVRGITINDAVVIVDECQNMDFHELDSIMTRYGRDCRYFFCGDFRQADLKSNGIKKFFDILRSLSDDFEYTEFTESDIVRSDVVKRYIIARNKQEDLTDAFSS